MIRKLYSQAGQDLWVMRDVFNWMTGGYFLDIGAAGGIELSNTCALERHLSWNGLCIEADPASFQDLQSNRRCKMLNACLAGKPGKVRFAGRSTFFGGINDPAAPLNPGEQVLEFEARTLQEVLIQEKVPETIHYLTIDVEGAEEEILSTFPFRTHRFLSATIERPGEGLREVLKSEGYLLVAEQPGLDAFYLHPSLGDSYRIHAIEAARFRSLSPVPRLKKTVRSLLGQGLRSSMRKL